MKKEYIINRQGKDFVTYPGLLDQAHQEGLKRITTRIIQIPTQDNGMMAIVSAEVETERGVFTEIGDANPGNTNKMILPHILRLASTRAKARALRDAVNVGEAAIEELGGETEKVKDSEIKRDRAALRERLLVSAGGEESGAWSILAGLTTRAGVPMNSVLQMPDKDIEAVYRVLEEGND